MMDLAVSVAPWAAFFGAVYCAAWKFSPSLFEAARGLSPADRAYWSTCCSSFVNGIVTTSLAAAECWRSGLITSGDFNFTTPGSHLVCHALLGYLVVDSIVLCFHLRVWAGSGMFAVHHAVALFGWVTCAHFDYVHNVAVPVVLCEATGPIINLRWFLSKAGKKETALYAANGVAIFVSWLVLRVIFLGWMAYDKLIVHQDAFLALGQPTVGAFLVCYLSSYMLQLAWFWKILKGVIALFSSDKPKPKRAAAPPAPPPPTPKKRKFRWLLCFAPSEPGLGAISSTLKAD